MTTPRLTTVATCTDVADLAVVQAFGQGAMNPGRAYPGRDSFGDGWDPLSMEGPHRSTWHLTGYRLVGQVGSRAVYVWRFAVNGGGVYRFAAAVVDVAATPARIVTVHAYDYQPGSETTRAGAEEKAAAVLAELEAAAGDTAAALDDETFAKVAGHSRPTRLTMDEVIELVKAPSGERPRIYAYWRDQIVSVPSGHYVEKYEGEARAWWRTGTTVADLVRRSA